MNSRFSSVGVVGSGAWGTALAQLSASNGADTSLWALEPEVATTVNNTHYNNDFLPEIKLLDSIRATASLKDLAHADAIVFVTPTQFARPIMSELASILPDEIPVLLCAKGIEQGSSALVSEIAEEVWPRARLAVLSGPSFAHDVARGLPTAITLACPSADLGGRWIETLGAPHFRPYYSEDIVGAELGGAIKNVIAIAAGVAIGKKFGESARAALIARGFVEFQRLGVAMGANAQTMAGLSGLGDLILTATSERSRNTSLGIALGQGRTVDEVLSTRQSVSEGAATASAVVALAARKNVEMPICAAVDDLVAGRKTADDVIDELLARSFKPETK